MRLDTLVNLRLLERRASYDAAVEGACLLGSTCCERLQLWILAWLPCLASPEKHAACNVMVKADLHRLAEDFVGALVVGGPILRCHPAATCQAPRCIDAGLPSRKRRASVARLCKPLER